MSPQPDPNPASLPELPPESVRGFVSLLIVIHFFAVAIGLSSYTNASPLQVRLVRTLAPYLRTFNFDLTHTYSAVARLHLTHAGDADLDFSIEGTSKLPDGNSEAWTLPRAGLWPRIRYQREQTLVNVGGGLIGNDDLETVLPRAFVASEFAASAKSGKITVVQHYLQTIDAQSSSETARRDPFDKIYFNDLYQAQVIGSSTGVDFLKTTAAGEVAPVTGRGPSAPLPAPSSKKE